MKTRRAKILAASLLIGVLLSIWSLTSPQAVSMRVLSLDAKKYSSDLAKITGSAEFVSATIELTNAGKRAITYWGFYKDEYADYVVLQETSFGWKDPPLRLRCGIGMREWTLAPAQAVTLKAVVERTNRCKVALNYSDGRTQNPYWKMLPWGLADKIPWAQPWRRVTTGPIDPSSVPEIATAKIR